MDNWSYDGVDNNNNKEVTIRELQLLWVDNWEVTFKESMSGGMCTPFPSFGGTQIDAGTSKLYNGVWMVIVEFLGKESTMALKMGLNINTTTIPV